jgi:hypothetical protein
MQSDNKSKDIRRINCTQCAAPLSLHGGHKVSSLTCGFCGSVMDAHADFAILKRYKKLRRPNCPIKIGMSGVIKDVEFTVIGMVRYTSERIYHWVDLQLYSPTHGYAFLTYENRHFVFSRRIRDLPMPGKISRFKEKAPVTVSGRKFRAFEEVNAEINFVEGELTWVAKVGDKSHSIDCIAPPYGFSYEGNDNEIEYFLSEYIDQPLIYKAFNIDEIDQPTLKPSDNHPLRPYPKEGLLHNLGIFGGMFGFAALVIGIFILIFAGGNMIADQQFSRNTPNETVSFKVDNPDQLLELTLHSSVSNNWAYYDISVLKGTEEVFSFGHEISYYEGYEGGESWSEGSTNGSALFKVPSAGTYHLGIVGGSSSLSSVPPVFIRIYDNVTVARYFMILAFLGLAFFIGEFIWHRHSEQYRWGETGDD